MCPLTLLWLRGAVHALALPWARGSVEYALGAGDLKRRTHARSQNRFCLGLLRNHVDVIFFRKRTDGIHAAIGGGYRVPMGSLDLSVHRCCVARV